MHAIAATSWSSDRIDVLYLNPSLAMQHKVWDGTQWVVGWNELDGEFATSPAAVTLGPDRLHAFGVGTDYAMYHKAYTAAGWAAGWENLGGSFVSAPTAV